MTAQSRDVVRFAGAEHDLAECDGVLEPLDLEARGVSPVFADTSCWDSVRLGFRVDDELLLDRLEIAVAGDEAPVLFGRRPRRRTRHGTTWLSYRGLAQPRDFTGALLLGRGRRGALVPPAFDYESVLELRFESGRLHGAMNATDEMGRLRARWETRPLPAPDDPESFATARAVSRAYAGFFASRRAVAG